MTDVGEVICGEVERAKDIHEVCFAQLLAGHDQGALRMALLTIANEASGEAL